MHSQRHTPHTYKHMHIHIYAHTGAQAIQVKDPSLPEQQPLVRLVSVSLTPTYDSAFEWGNRRWQDSSYHEEPLDMLALLAAAEVDGKGAVGSREGNRTGLGRGLDLGTLGGRGDEGGRHGKRVRGGDENRSDREGGARGVPSASKRARQGDGEGGQEVSGVVVAVSGPLLKAGDPKHVQVSHAEQYLQRLARENYDVFSAVCGGGEGGRCVCVCARARAHACACVRECVLGITSSCSVGS